jgi:hypothetical protein
MTAFRTLGASADVGRGEFMAGVVKMKHAFKTPGLREITRRSPFMHDGSLATLEAVVEHYNNGGVDRPSRSDLVKPLGLTPQEKSELVAFLKTLSSNLDPPPCRFSPLNRSTPAAGPSRCGNRFLSLLSFSPGCQPGMFPPPT